MPLGPALTGLWPSGPLTIGITPEGTFFRLGAPGVTGPGDAMISAQVFGPPERGTCALATDGGSWGFNPATGSHTCTRATP